MTCRIHLHRPRQGVFRKICSGQRTPALAQTRRDGPGKIQNVGIPRMRQQDPCPQEDKRGPLAVGKEETPRSNIPDLILPTSVILISQDVVELPFTPRMRFLNSDTIPNNTCFPTGTRRASLFVRSDIPCRSTEWRGRKVLIPLQPWRLTCPLQK